METLVQFPDGPPGWEKTSHQGGVTVPGEGTSREPDSR